MLICCFCLSNINLLKLDCATKNDHYSVLYIFKTCLMLVLLLCSVLVSDRSQNWWREMEELKNTDTVSFCSFYAVSSLIHYNSTSTTGLHIQRSQSFRHIHTNHPFFFFTCFHQHVDTDVRSQTHTELYLQDDC